MSRYSLGFDDEETRSLTALGLELQGVLEVVQEQPEGVVRYPWGDLPVAKSHSPRREWSQPSLLVGWAGSEHAHLLMTSDRERRRFETWEKEVFLTAGMPQEWSDVTARQLTEAWEVLGWAMASESLPAFLRALAAAAGPRPRRRFVRLRQWWGSVREALGEFGSDDGALTMGGFASGLCNSVFAPTHFDENAASTVASTVIAAPTCLKAIRNVPPIRNRGPWGEPAENGYPRRRALDQWAECLSAVITTWP